MLLVCVVICGCAGDRQPSSDTPKEAEGIVILILKSDGTYQFLPSLKK